MKVVVINPNYYRSSGVTVAISRLFVALRRYPLEWTFVTCRYGPESESQRPEWLDRGDYLFYDLMSTNPIRVALSWVKLSIFMHKWRPEVIHVHHRRLALMMLPFSWAVGASIVYTAHLNYKFSAPFRILTFPWVVAIGTSVLENVKSTMSYGHVALIGNALMFPDSPLAVASTARKNIVCVGRFAEAKNHRKLLLAWARVVRVIPDASLLLVGEGPLRAELERMCSALGLDGRVNFVGYASSPNCYFAQSLFAVLPSLVEGFPIVGVEAAAMGRATLASSVPGARDLVPPGNLLQNCVSPDDEEALADALMEWLNNPELVIREGVQFYAHHRSLHDQELVGEKHYKIYLEARSYRCI